VLIKTIKPFDNRSLVTILRQCRANCYIVLMLNVYPSICIVWQVSPTFWMKTMSVHLLFNILSH